MCLWSELFTWQYCWICRISLIKNYERLHLLSFMNIFIIIIQGTEMKMLEFWTVLPVSLLRRTLASSSQSECASCHKQWHLLLLLLFWHAARGVQGHAGSKTLLQQNPPVLNWGYWLTQVTCKALVVVISPSPPVDNVWAILIVQRIRGKIIGCVLCCIVYHGCAQWYTTHMCALHRSVQNHLRCLSLIHIWRCRRSTLCRSRWSPYH